MSNRLELQYNFFQQHPEYVLCGGHGIFINQRGEQIDDSNLIVPIGIEKIKMMLLFGNTSVNSSVMYKTTVFRELNGYQDYAPAEDYELFIRMAEKYPVGNLDEILVKYRMHENNISSLKRETAILKLKEITNKQLAYLGIPDHQQLGHVLCDILLCDCTPRKFSDYHQLFLQLKSANRKLRRFPFKEFEEMLFEKWFTIKYQKKAKMNAITLLFNKDLFSWPYLTARQLRKGIKLSLKGVGELFK